MSRDAGNITEVSPHVPYQRCKMYFYRNVLLSSPEQKMQTVTIMLKAIRAQNSKKAAREEAVAV